MVLNERMNNIVGLFHLQGMILQSVYGLVSWRQTIGDKIYMTSFLLIPLSWILCKDECIISYLVKKMENPRYVIGERPYDTQDIIDIVGRDNYNVFFHLNHIVRMISVLRVNERTIKIEPIYLFPTLVLYTIYSYNIHYQYNYIEGELIRYLLCGYLVKCLFYKKLKICFSCKM
jgi:hypothetical protein